MFAEFKYTLNLSEETKPGLGELVVTSPDAYSAAQGAHAIAIATEWDEFKTLDYKKIYDSMAKPAFLFDGRNIVDAAALRGEYRKRVALSADKHCRLAEVTSCWRKQPDGSVGEQCDCPPHVMKGRDNSRCASLVVAQLGQCLAADSKR